MDTAIGRRMNEQKLKILVFGAGAIGSYIGGSLAGNGYQVHFVDRKETLERIRSRGIKLVMPDREFEIKPEYLWVDAQSAIKNEIFDFAIVAVKSYDTLNLINSWQSVRSNIPPVVSFQNGVDNEKMIADLIGLDKTIAGTVTTAIGIQNEKIIVERLRGMGIEKKDDITDQIFEALKTSGLNPVGFQDALSMKWSKLITNLTTNASSAILGVKPAQILSDKQLFSIEIDQLREALNVMNAGGIKITDLPGTAVRTFAFFVQKVPKLISRLILYKSIVSGRGDKMPSFYIDLINGRGQSEVDYLNGAVVRYGEIYGVKTPVNRKLNETLIKMTNGEIPLTRFQGNFDRYKKLIKE